MWSAIFRLIGSGVATGGAEAAAAGAGAGNLTGVLNKATGAMKSFGDTVQGEMFKSLSAFELMKKGLNYIVEGFENAAHQAKQFTNLSLRFNMPAAQIASLSNFANDAGISVGTLAKGMQQMASFGSKWDTNKKFKDLKGLIGASKEEMDTFSKAMSGGGAKAYALLAERMKSVTDEGEKMQVLQGLFGRGAMQMRQLIEKSPEEIEKEMANSYSADESSYKRVAEYEQMLSQLSTLGKVTGLQLMALVAPIAKVGITIAAFLLTGLNNALSIVRLISSEVTRIYHKMMQMIRVGDAAREHQKLAENELKNQKEIEKNMKAARDAFAQIAGFSEKAAENAEKVKASYEAASADSDAMRENQEQIAYNTEKEAEWRMYSQKQLQEHNAKIEEFEVKKLEQKRQSFLDEQKDAAIKDYGRSEFVGTTAELSSKTLEDREKWEKERRDWKAMTDEQKAALALERGRSVEQIGKDYADGLPDHLLSDQEYNSKYRGTGKLRMQVGTVGEKAKPLLEEQALAEKELQELQGTHFSVYETEFGKKEMEGKIARAQIRLANARQAIKEQQAKGDLVMSQFNPRLITDAEGVHRYETKQEVIDRLARSGVQSAQKPSAELGLEGVKLEEKARKARLAEGKKGIAETESAEKITKEGKSMFYMFQEYVNSKTNPMANLDLKTEQAADQYKAAQDKLQRLQGLKDVDPAEVMAARAEVIKARANQGKVWLDNRDKVASFYQTTGDSLQAIGGGGQTSLSASSLFKRQADDVEQIKYLMIEAMGYSRKGQAVEGGIENYDKNMGALVTQEWGKVFGDRL